MEPIKIDPAVVSAGLKKLGEIQEQQRIDERQMGGAVADWIDVDEATPDVAQFRIKQHMDKVLLIFDAPQRMLVFTPQQARLFKSALDRCAHSAARYYLEKENDEHKNKLQYHSPDSGGDKLPPVPAG